MKRFLKFSEKIAVQYSDVVITDNEAISEYVLTSIIKIAELLPMEGSCMVKY